MSGLAETTTVERMIPLATGPERLRAEAIGRIVLKFSVLDSMLIFVLYLANFDLERVSGQSGSQLSALMREVENTSEVEEGLRVLADRYDDATRRRNRIIHGRHEGEVIMHMQRATKRNREAFMENVYETQEVSLADLVDLWYDLDDLDHDLLALMREMPWRERH